MSKKYDNSSFFFQKINSGDLVTASATAIQKVKSNIIKRCKAKIEESEVDKLLGTGLTVPEPVFFCSIEPPSLSAHSVLEQALVQLQREDPSLRVSQNIETGQTILAGRYIISMFSFSNHF